jgi:ArsR family transcriptional regulator
MYAHTYECENIPGDIMDESKFLRCVMEDTRRNILKFLGKDEKCVCEIVDFIGKEQSVVSHHLASLRKCGLVQSRQDGKRVMYKVTHTDLIDFLLRGESLAQRIQDTGTECE